MPGELLESPTIECSTAVTKSGKQSGLFCALTPQKATTQKMAKSMIQELGQKTLYRSAGVL